MFGLTLLLIVAYDKVAGNAGDVVEGPDQPMVLPAAAVVESRGPVPTGISEYVFLHQNGYEDVRIHTMSGRNACPQ